MKIKGSIIIIIFVLAVVVYNGAYTVDETEQVVITQFGRIVGEPKTSPGLKFKIPFIQNANYFNKNLWIGMATRGRFPPWTKHLSGSIRLPGGKSSIPSCFSRR